MNEDPAVFGTWIMQKLRCSDQIMTTSAFTHEWDKLAIVTLQLGPSHASLTATIIMGVCLIFYNNAAL